VTVLAIIPARGGSKGVPGKNIRPLAGKPLLAWSIEAALASRVGRIVVSSDSTEILEVATRYGAEPLERPAELATDDAPTDEVLVHALVALGVDGYHPDLVVLLQPTVPVRRAGLIEECTWRLLETHADSLLTAYPLHFVWWQESPSYWYDKTVGGSGRAAAPAWRTQCPRRPPRQHMVARELMWHEDGSVFVCRAELLRTTGRRVGGRMEVFETERTVDIDTEHDFAVAEALLLARQGCARLLA
jgi:CMP-N,N'-diacetyllegionaminic acid synthase